MVRHFHYIQWGGSYLSRWSNTHSSDWGGSWGWYGHNLSLPITDNILLLLQILSDMLRHNLGFYHGLNLSNHHLFLHFGRWNSSNRFDLFLDLNWLLSFVLVGIGILWITEYFLLWIVPFALVVWGRVIVSMRLLRLVDILEIINGILTLDFVLWLHNRSWFAVDTPFGGQLGLFFFLQVFLLLFVILLCLLDLGHGFCDFVLCF